MKNADTAVDYVIYMDSLFPSPSARTPLADLAVFSQSLEVKCFFKNQLPCK